MRVNMALQLPSPAVDRVSQYGRKRPNREHAHRARPPRYRTRNLGEPKAASGPLITCSPVGAAARDRKTHRSSSSRSGLSGCRQMVVERLGDRRSVAFVRWCGQQERRVHLGNARRSLRMPFKKCAEVDRHGSCDQIQQHVRPSVGTESDWRVCRESSARFPTWATGRRAPANGVRGTGHVRVKCSSLSRSVASHVTSRSARTASSSMSRSTARDSARGLRFSVVRFPDRGVERLRVDMVEARGVVPATSGR